MDQNENEFTNAEARQAIEEVDAASQLVADALGDAPSPTNGALVDAQVQDAVSVASVDILRQKAQRQRQKGILHMARRHDGIASVVVNVTLRERVVASAFERYFTTIETGIQVISKSGAMFVGAKHADKLMQTIVDRIDAMEKRIKGELERLRVTMDVHQSRSDWIVPTYTRPAADHEVQLRTRLANRVVSIFRMNDEFVVALNQLSWNDESDTDAIDLAEFEIKKDLRGLADLIRRTLRGMRSKVTTLEETADATAPHENSDSEVNEPLAA